MNISRLIHSVRLVKIHPPLPISSVTIQRNTSQFNGSPLRLKGVFQEFTCQKRSLSTLREAQPIYFGRKYYNKDDFYGTFLRDTFICTVLVFATVMFRYIVLTRNLTYTKKKVKSEGRYAEYEINADDISSLRFFPSTTPDFEIVVEGEVFPVHRAVLASRSPLFENMLNSADQAVVNKLEMKDISKKVMRQMINFMYTLDVPTSPEDINEFMKAAERFQLTPSVSFVLGSNLTKENVCKRMELADKMGDDALFRKLAIYFTIRGGGLENKEWMELNRRNDRVAARAADVVMEIEV